MPSVTTPEDFDNWLRLESDLSLRHCVMGRLKRFLDLGTRDLGIGLEVLQNYVRVILGGIEAGEARSFRRRRHMP